MNLYYYKAYGLVFQSEFSIAGLTSEIACENPDVVLTIGTLDVTPYSLIKGFLIKEITPEGFLYGIKDLATFLLSDGNKVIVDPLTEETELWQMYLLGSVMGALLQQNGFLTLHGSAFVFNNKAHLILGASGMGKSSIAMALHQKGYELLTDDISAIKFDSNNKPYLFVASKHIKLWEDAIEHLSTAQEDMARVRESLPKFRLLLDTTHDQVKYELGNVFILNIKRLPEGQFAFKHLNTMQLLRYLNQNVYRKKFLLDMGNQKDAFFMLSQLANNAFGTLLNRTHSRTDVRLVAEKMEKFLKQ
ncbi:hypothetical protein [Roseivirga sp. E12]|uniref:hypothetical protein n=1 Tax=Roseivirga sp. E12 TaxID=2819237 RepID=UPI001ABC547D|nr:hypothetical protein [Roseivirga sp. E12]MBO3699056.1 hypothetical protein [Roseivirga sp. E12]